VLLASGASGTLDAGDGTIIGGSLPVRDNSVLVALNDLTQVQNASSATASDSTAGSNMATMLLSS
jgi:hypothetical protein